MDPVSRPRLKDNCTNFTTLHDSSVPVWCLETTTQGTKKFGHFTVDSQLLLELGERLVTKKSIALAELVKNAYDADAKSCTITLQNIEEAGGTIIIHDDGTGMTPESFTKTWLRIATTDSIDRPLSARFYRQRTGEKGVGRFACRVLANKLILESISQTRSQKTKEIEKWMLSATFDWESFKPGKDVNEIQVDYVVKAVSPTIETGTTITLKDVREAWKEKDIADMKRDIVTITSPFPVEKKPTTDSDPGFEVLLKTHESGPEVDLKETFFRAAIATLTGELGGRDQPLYTLRIRGEDGLIPWSPPDTFFRKLGPVKFTIHFFVYDSIYFSGIKIGLNFARELGREQGGVRIYMDGFRIFKYGDPNDDWLGLDSDKSKRAYNFPGIPSELLGGTKRPELSLPGNNNLFGQVEISRFTTPDLQPTITRDRLVDNEAFSQLRIFVRLGIDWMTIQYYKHRQKYAPAKTNSADVTKAIKTARENIEYLTEAALDQPSKNAVAELATAQQEIVSALEEQISELMMLRVLASTGTMITVFEHELGRHISKLEEVNYSLKELLNSRKFVPEVIQEAQLTLQDLTDNVKELGLHVGVLMSASSREARRTLAIRELAEDLLRPFNRHLTEYGITWENNVPPNLRTPKMFLCELDSILLNLLTNSIKAVKETKVRKISITARKQGGFLEVNFLDTGPGIPRNKREEVFTPFTSTSVPDPLFGQGTGLGLKIVKDTMMSYGGNVRIVDPPPNWSTCVSLTFPIKEV
jgi:signal transduction histidine kinase